MRLAVTLPGRSVLSTAGWARRGGRVVASVAHVTSTAAASTAGGTRTDRARTRSRVLAPARQLSPSPDPARAEMWRRRNVTAAPACGAPGAAARAPARSSTCATGPTAPPTTIAGPNRPPTSATGTAATFGRGRATPRGRSLEAYL